MKKRCSNCATYPFCSKCNDPKGKCDEWKKRQDGIKAKKIFIEEATYGELAFTDNYNDVEKHIPKI